MDLRESNSRRRLSPQPNPAGRNKLVSAARVAPSKSRLISPMNLTKILAALLVSLPVLVTLSLVLRNPSPDRIKSFADARIIERLVTNDASSSSSSEDGFSDHTHMPKDKLHDGLIVPGFDEASCLSRYQSNLYRKISPHKPSSHLLSRLRSYEDLHKKCGPHTKSYNKTLEQLKSGSPSTGVDSSEECKYVVWISYSGLGNKILTISSAFLYALLTNRVLLVDPGKDMADLFCEPFPENSWLLPDDFPVKDRFNAFDQKSPHCYGNILKSENNKIANASPSFLYLHLAHDYDEQDKLFFCDDEQSLIEKVPWLFMRTDNYFVPSLFLMPSFEQELEKLFPEKETVFHHLGRYLFHPSNHVWGLITRYYQAYLARADERIGIQVRTFEAGPSPLRHVMNQIYACAFKEKLLPRVERKKPIVTSSPGKPKLKSVLITSLTSGYSEDVRNMYWEHPTVNGDTIGVFQPSHEGHQQTDKNLHDQKAWAEMYLLSLCDVLVTSAWSTFGYVAQGLGGLKPWILYKPENKMTPDPPCGQVMSMEPCFHAPPFYDCKAKKGVDTGALVPHVRHCEDMSWGLKLVDSHESHDQL
ncbi:galactoside 2-alpha-L-fucosyltransferase-like [Malus sylvestris]|uniref:galactoside 2-alpha-L-fucosyltransferase-like n=1 Tax=Malus sylvestris TaxID=3752 RepID=UPI0021AC0909|nr:galactoside 2-alpha-L-fucosyltransferase-like [Malus sylvestris]